MNSINQELTKQLEEQEAQVNRFCEQLQDVTRTFTSTAKEYVAKLKEGEI